MGTATNEVALVGTNTRVVGCSLDGRHRLSALAVSAAPSQVHYVWDAENRLVGVSNGTFAVSYAFSAGGHEAGHTVTLTNGITLTRVITRDGHRRHLVTGVSNAVSRAMTSNYRYGHDPLGRITSRNADPFGYNARSEITSAAISPNDYRYAYDEMGNSRFATLNVSTNFYTANALNQYTNILCASAPPREETSLLRLGWQLGHQRCLDLHLGR